jgi:hypothetical protein
MHIQTLKKAALALTLWLALYASSLRAQIFTAPLQASTTGTDPVDFEFRADGTMIAKGNFGVGSLLSTDEGAGTRMLWFPDLSAFRAGTITSGGTEWDLANIGTYSTAFGSDTLASNSYSTAFGLNTTASGAVSTAFGDSSTASGYIATAMGNGATASGLSSVAIGQATTASGGFSVGLGSYSTASGYGSWALGYQTDAVGTHAMALGVYSVASGNNSVAIGFSCVASGNRSIAIGGNASASSYDSFGAGRYSVGGGSTTAWVSTDPLFEIGNGSGPYSNQVADAFVVYKNGNAQVQGTLRCSPGGDLSMGNFTAGTAP